MSNKLFNSKSYKTFVIWILTFIWILSFGFCHSISAATLERGTFEAVAEENNPEFIEQYRILIENRVGGRIGVSKDQGTNWQEIGLVLLPTQKVNPEAFTASRWLENSAVVATAVNAIHVRTGFNTLESRGIVFSILPADELHDVGAIEKTILASTEVVSHNSSIYTTVLGGEGIFGGGFSPYVANKVFLKSKAGPVPLTPGFVPRIGDDFLIVVERPKRYPKEIVFENRFGGLITIKYIDGEEKIIGEVLKPVLGVGRFVGSELAGVGRIRANHPGVIEVSTSPLYETGAFQIIPSGHGMSPEMVYARAKTQWLVVGPPSVKDPSFEGIAPLFKYFLSPYYLEEDLFADDWQEKLLKRPLVDAKAAETIGWQALPIYTLDPNKELPSWAGRCLDNVTHIRILFPIYLTDGLW